MLQDNNVVNFILTRTKVSHTTSKNFLEALVSRLNPDTIYTLELYKPQIKK